MKKQKKKKARKMERKKEDEKIEIFVLGFLDFVKG